MRLSRSRSPSPERAAPSPAVTARRQVSLSLSVRFWGPDVRDRTETAAQGILIRNLNLPVLIRQAGRRGGGPRGLREVCFFPLRSRDPWRQLIR